MLIVLRQLQICDVSLNSIGNLGAGALVHSAKSCRCLQELRLEGNPCDPKYNEQIRQLLALPATDRLICREDPNYFFFLQGRGWRYRGNISRTWHLQQKENANQKRPVTAALVHTKATQKAQVDPTISLQVPEPEN